MLKFKVTCEAVATSQRFSRIFIATDRTAALHSASLALASEAGDYYIISIERI